jgi:penicillin-binding protein 1A
VAIVLDASPREVRAQLAGGEQVRISGAGLRQALPGLQPRAAAALALRRGSVIRLQGDIGRDGLAWSIVQWPEAEGAFVRWTRPAAACVRWWAASTSPSASSTTSPQAWRQPGSSFKPFLYSAALRAGVMPETVVDDAPLTPAEGASDDWNPKNSDGQFDGPMTVREAMVKSEEPGQHPLLRQVGLPQPRPGSHASASTRPSSPTT